MSKVLVNDTDLSGIASAIRQKTGGSTLYKPSEMAQAVRDISTGITPTGTKNITQNGTHDVTNYASADVNVPNSYSASDEGKVVDNGALVSQTSKNVTQNGTYDTTTNDEVVVNVQGGGGGTIEPLSVTQNGTYAPPSGVDGYAPVVVNVPGAEEDWTALKDYIESSGIQYINTGYSPIGTTKFEVIANAPDNSTSYPCLIGERTSPTNEIVIYTEFYGGNLGLVWANGDSAATSDDVRQYYIGNKCKYVLGGDGLRGVLNANGYGFVYVKAAGTFATLPIFIFVLNDNGTPNSVTYCSAKLYRFRIYESDTLVHEFVPWTDENDVVCLKDTVTGNLKYNQGTGVFVRGTDL